MLLYRFNRFATAIRLVGLALIVWSLLGSISHPTSSGRGVLVALLSAAAVIAWLSWTARPNTERGVTLDLYVLAVRVACWSAPRRRAPPAAFAFVGIASAGFRVELPRALPILALGVLALCVSVLIYDGSERLARWPTRSATPPPRWLRPTPANRSCAPSRRSGCWLRRSGRRRSSYGWPGWRGRLEPRARYTTSSLTRSPA